MSEVEEQEEEVYDQGKIAMDCYTSLHTLSLSWQPQELYSNNHPLPADQRSAY